MPPRSTPPAAGETHSVSEPEPDTRGRFPANGVATIVAVAVAVAVAVIAVVFLVVVGGLILMAHGVW